MHEPGTRRDDDFDTWLRSDYQALQEMSQYMTILADDDVPRLAISRVTIDTTYSRSPEPDTRTNVPGAARIAPVAALTRLLPPRE
jgi:hypothetical protein